MYGDKNNINKFQPHNNVLSLRNWSQTNMWVLVPCSKWVLKKVCDAHNNYPSRKG